MGLVVKLSKMTLDIRIWCHYAECHILLLLC
jgi:hypothetical protein